VVINYHSRADAAEQVAAQAREEHGVRAITVKADVSSKAAVTVLFETAKKALGRVDIVMSNSGIEHFGSLAETTEEQIDKVFAVNVKGQYFVAQLADKYVETGGRLILMSSVSAVWVSSYTSSAPHENALTSFHRASSSMPSTLRPRRPSPAWSSASRATLESGTSR
jgi:NAD(P)-dependent dehydrogenase (short-subunit alcohol dehydrogenase family)